MHKLFTLLVLLVIPIFADIAIVKTTQGKVTIKRGYKILPVKVGDLLNEDDVIITDKSSSIGIVFKDGTRLSLGSKSYIVLEKYIYEPTHKNFAFDLNMSKGKALFESGKFGKMAPEAVKFKVPKGIIGIDGTKFYVKVI
jgi:hypothetical protein